ncbi:uncharacterized protein IUM83_19616 [Phytophthora cinnamomi]|uniref:uncharacterized protein n=1 Tax=Phytophthora cinnamomi TaxID=4785 RepID=UPI00355A1BE5|nr:hypothetical protein IUM83_19616 [Phytophthora cinnamomi]
MIIGVGPFGIDIADNKTVADLCQSLRRSGKPGEQPLFLGKKDGKWLTRRKKDVQALEHDNIPKSLEEVLDDRNILDPQRPLSEFNLPGVDECDMESMLCHFIFEPKNGQADKRRRATRRRAKAEQRRKGSASGPVGSSTFVAGEVGIVIYSQKKNLPKKAPWL